MNLPEWSVYCEHTEAVNALRFDLGSLTVWFSYKTPVAFLKRGALLVRKNEWGSTTGKHLNAIDRGAKNSRVLGCHFERQLQAALQES